MNMRNSYGTGPAIAALPKVESDNERLRLKAELARLRAECKKWQQCCANCIIIGDELRAENERLRAAVIAAVGAIPPNLAAVASCGYQLP